MSMVRVEDTSFQRTGHEAHAYSRWRPSEALKMQLFSKNRSLASRVAVSALGGLLIAGCLSSPGEETGLAEQAVEEAPPPRPVPLCQNPVIKDITCSYVGFQTGTLIGEPTLTQTGSGKFVDFVYTQSCKFTTAV